MTKRIVAVDLDEMEETIARGLRAQWYATREDSDKAYKEIPDMAKYWAKVILVFSDNSE